jgi:hypothetical protein
MGCVSDGKGGEEGGGARIVTACSSALLEAFFLLGQRVTGILRICSGSSLGDGREDSSSAV